MRLVIGMATVLGVVGPIAAFGLFYLGDRVYHLNHAHLQTLMYLMLSVAGSMTIYLTRTRGPFWSIRPARILVLAVHQRGSDRDPAGGLRDLHDAHRLALGPGRLGIRDDLVPADRPGETGRVPGSRPGENQRYCAVRHARGARRCGRKGPERLRLSMTAAAAVLASATTATAARKARWMLVPQMWSGMPRPTARPIAHSPVSPVGTHRPVRSTLQGPMMSSPMSTTRAPSRRRWRRPWRLAPGRGSRAGGLTSRVAGISGPAGAAVARIWRPGHCRCAGPRPLPDTPGARPACSCGPAPPRAGRDTGLVCASPGPGPAAAQQPDAEHNSNHRTGGDRDPGLKPGRNAPARAARPAKAA